MGVTSEVMDNTTDSAIEANSAKDIEDNSSKDNSDGDRVKGEVFWITLHESIESGLSSLTWWWRTIYIFSALEDDVTMIYLLFHSIHDIQHQWVRHGGN